MKEERSEKMYSLADAARLTNSAKCTIRRYRDEGILKPRVKGRFNYYSEDDLACIRSLKEYIHLKNRSLYELKLILRYSPCWEITECPEEIVKQCTAGKNAEMDCWERPKTFCRDADWKDCNKCVVYHTKRRLAD